MGGVGLLRGLLGSELDYVLEEELERVGVVGQGAEVGLLSDTILLS